MAGKKVGASEFAGGGGLIQLGTLQEAFPTETQQLWEMYATNSAGTDGSELIDPARVGVPESYQASHSGGTA